MKVEKIWKSIEKSIETNSSVETTGYVTRLILPESNFDVYLAIEQPENRRLLMMNIQHSLVDRNTVYPSFNCFEIRRVILPNDNPDYFTLQLILSKPSYTDIFSALVQDIIDNLVFVEQEELAIVEFINRLHRWQKFLEKYDCGGLSKILQQGLYGELWFLQHKAIALLGCCQGVQSWTGATGTQQDFQFKNCAVEVKTTATKKHQKISIASERQLDETGINSLLLFHISLEIKKNSGSESLPEIVENIRLLISQDTMATEYLENLLFEAGYLDTHVHLYEDNRYTIKELNYFQVKEIFPRIIETDLRSGVGDVRYTISVDQCKNFSISEDEADILMLNDKS